MTEAGGAGPARPLHILQVSTSPSWGGMEMETLRISTGLRARGLGVTLLCHPDGTLRREAEAHGLPVWTIPFENGVHLREILALRSRLGADRMDLVHLHFSRDLRFVVPAMEGMARRPRLILTKHVGSFIAKKDLLHRWLYARLDLVIAISRVIRQNLLDTCPVDPAKVIVQYNGVDRARYAAASSARDRVRADLGLGDDEIVVGMVARFSRGKGQEEFLRAAALILAEARAGAAPGGTHLPGLRFLVVGGASYGEEAYEAEVRELAAGLHLGDAVIFTGFRRDAPELIAAMDIVACPSHAEAFGNVAVEAMAVGRAVVASNSDGLRDIVTDGVNGLAVPPRDAVLLAAGVRALILDPGLRERLVRAGRRDVQERFDEARQLDELVRRYENLIGRRRD